MEERVSKGENGMHEGGGVLTNAFLFLVNDASPLFHPPHPTSEKNTITIFKG